uniref:hypothetical protein n=1 Tax=Arcticibacter sp. TaxID=1872630 RepID=UPI00388FE45B
MQSVLIEEYYSYLTKQVYYHFDIELIYTHLKSLKGSLAKGLYLEKLTKNYELDVKSCKGDHHAPTEYFVSMKHFKIITQIAPQCMEYNFGKYQHALYLLLLEWKTAVGSNRSLKAPAHIIESEFYRNYGNPI